MTKEKWTIRTYPAGAASSGIPYTVKLHADDSPLAIGNTASDGSVTYAPSLSPGPHYITATDTAPTPDAVRVVSSKSSGGGGGYSLAEVPIVLRSLGNGVVRGYLNTCAVSYDGAGLDLDTNTGGMSVMGIPAVINASIHQSVTSTRDATNPKQCYWVAEFTGIGEAEEGKVVLKDVCGAAGASPSLPSLTQSESTYQFPLATFRLPNSSSTTLTQLTDVRTYLLARNPVVSSIVQRTDPTAEGTTTSSTGADATSLTTTVTLLNGVVYDLQANAFLTCKTSSVAFPAQMAVYLNGTGNIGTYVSTNSTAYVGLGNALSLSGVTGTGAAVSCGVRIKIAGGTMTYSTGLLQVTAVPRS